MARINLSNNLFRDDDGPPDEVTVQRLVAVLRQGGSLIPPVLAQWKDGRCTIVEGRCRVAAGIRCGRTHTPAFIVNGDELGLDKLRELRRGLNELNRLQN
jgi:hypothetical protein